MSTHDAFAQKFRELLRDVPNDYTLEQWQHAYRQVMFFMGMRILERFSNDAVNAIEAQPAQKIGPHPCPPPLAFPAFVLEVQSSNGNSPNE